MNGAPPPPSEEPTPVLLLLRPAEYSELLEYVIDAVASGSHAVNRNDVGTREDVHKIFVGLTAPLTAAEIARAREAKVVKVRIIDFVPPQPKTNGGTWSRASQCAPLFTQP